MGRRRTFDPAAVRTLAFAGHRSAGKTSLGEALLRAAGATRTLGSVDRRTTLLDHHDEERRRKLSLQNAYAWLEWRSTLVQFVDTPGSAVVSHVRNLALTGADGVVLVVDSTAGVEFGTEEILLAHMNKPLVCVLNKADRRRNLDAVIARLEVVAGRRVLPMQLPFRDDDDEFAGVVCLTTMSVLRYAPDGSGAYSSEPIPDRYRQAAATAWEHVVESVALTDDALLERYLEFMELETTEFTDALRAAVLAGVIVPAFYTSATGAIGVEPLLDAMVELLPSPREASPPLGREPDGNVVQLSDPGFVGQVVSAHLDSDGHLYHVFRVWSGEPPRSGQFWNTSTQRSSRIRRLYQVRGPRRAVATTTGPGALLAIWNDLDATPGDTLTDGADLVLPTPPRAPPMMAYTVAGKDPAGVRKLPRALQLLTQIDSGLQVRSDHDGDFLLAGRDDSHLALAVKRLNEMWGIPVRTALPPVEYIETPLEGVEDVEGVHVLEDVHGLVEEYGACRVDLSPQPLDKGNRFVDGVSDDEALPPRYRPAIDQGAMEALAHGPTAGYPVVGAEIRLRGGEYDILQSTDDHFVAAGRIALRAALARSGTRLLEPWWTVEAKVPQECVGDVLADVSAHRGRILGVEPGEDSSDARIRALGPFRELRTFAARLQGLTGGRGRFSTAASHYEPLPGHLVKEAIAQSPHRSSERGKSPKRNTRPHRGEAL